MARLFEGDEIVLATHNKGKVAEISDLLGEYATTFYSAGDLGLSEPVEDADTFIGNAEIKAQSAARESGKISLSDDSGLCVVALNGDPGVYSARWAGPDKDFGVAMAKIEAALEGHSNHDAYFICVLSMAWPDGHVESFEGRVNGHLEFPPRGDRGFGYDPIFVPEGYDITFAEMDPAQKHAMSHRAAAFKKLVSVCFVDKKCA